MLSKVSKFVHFLLSLKLIFFLFASQWFGNLVTMAWWEELWLNEGFASFVEFYGVNATEPNWKMVNAYDDCRKILLQ